MGVVSVPGMSIDKSVLRRRGIIFVVVVAVILLVIYLVQHFWPKNDFDLTLRTPNVAAGIVAGAPVKMNGFEIGKVGEVRSLGNGQQGVDLVLEPAKTKGITDSVEAAFSAGNLFGVSEVELIPHPGGSSLKSGAQLTPQRQITDNSVSNMITTLGDVNSDAIRPHMGEILRNVDASTKAMLPLTTALGNVAQAVQDTQKLSTAETFPQIARAIQAADGTAAAMLPAVQNLFDLDLVHNQAYVQRTLATEDALTNHTDSLTARLQQLLNPASVQGLAKAAPLVTGTMQMLLQLFPNAGTLGIQLGQVMNNVRAAMPVVGAGPVLNVNLSVDVPALGAALPPIPTFQVVQPAKPGPTAGGRQPAAKPSAGAAVKPSAKNVPTSTAKAGN
ncbi:MlaD family protein [Tsukamurella sp. 8F]|uniref:MlaD family protein n=1 Tax=unclassified Tsukamurella TaxID=2633480 RepID=UPI0023B92EBA|nr:MULTISPECIES: MlaD family protein [unclassified Tsukamurella]MDF0530307.1 MlaD family protein [Tsukamurella sp. 8J]MDF0587604.1 MlaD family protein [Tsukamurella sp. 8F]